MFAIWGDVREQWERGREGDAVGLLLQVPLCGAAKCKKTWRESLYKHIINGHQGLRHRGR